MTDTPQLCKPTAPLTKEAEIILIKVFPDGTVAIGIEEAFLEEVHKGNEKAVKFISSASREIADFMKRAIQAN